MATLLVGWKAKKPRKPKNTKKPRKPMKPRKLRDQGEAKNARKPRKVFASLAPWLSGLQAADGCQKQVTRRKAVLR